MEQEPNEVRSFTYLGSMVSTESETEEAIPVWIGKARTALILNDHSLALSQSSFIDNSLTLTILGLVYSSHLMTRI